MISQKEVCSDFDNAGVMLLFFKNLPNTRKREGKNQNFWGNKREDMLKEGHKKSSLVQMLDTNDKSDINTFLGL